MPFTATSTPIHTLESPGQNASVLQPFAVSSWAIEGAAVTWTGIDAIGMWQYANVGSGTAPTQRTGVTTGISRPDVAAVYGARFQPSGYSKSLGSVPAGIYWYEVLAHSTATGAWTIRTAQTYVDLPTAELTITRGGTGTGQVLGPRVLGS